MNIRCPSCSTVYKLSFDLEPGHHVECDCGTKFKVGPETLMASEDEDEEAVEEALQPGALIGRCRIERKIADGAMGTVYLAQHMTLDIPVAVKVLSAKYASHTEYKQRFSREARTAAKLNHPNVVRVLDCGEDEGGPLYLVMEYMDGGSVRDMLDEHGRLPLLTVLDIAASVCRALMAAEQYGIVHRDIKPDNIMFSSKGVYKLADLGLARYGRKQPNDPKLTLEFTGMGTPHYIAPEQAFNASDTDIRADIYALGATMYHLACGRPPFPGESSFEVIQAHAKETCPSPSTLSPPLGSEFDDVVGKAMMKSREKRYQSPSEMLAAIQELRPDSPKKQAVAARRRGMQLAAVASLAFVAVLIALIVLNPRNPAHNPNGNSGTGGNGTGGGGIPPAQAETQRTLEFGRLDRGARGASTYVAVTVPGFAADGPDESSREEVVLEMGSERIVLDSLDHGEFRAEGDTEPGSLVGEELSLVLRAADGTVQRRTIVVPPLMTECLEPLEPKVDLSDDLSLSLGWMPIPACPEAKVRVELGWVSNDGRWRPELVLRPEGRENSVTLSESGLTRAVRAMPANAQILMRFIAETETGLGPGSPQWRDRLALVAEKPLPRSHRVLQFLEMPEGVRKWLHLISQPDFDDKQRQDVTNELWGLLGVDAVPHMLQLVLSERKEPRYWAAYYLCEMCPVESTRARIEGENGILSFENRRLLAHLHQVAALHRSELPEAFPEWLRRLSPRRRGPLERPRLLRERVD